MSNANVDGTIVQKMIRSCNDTLSRIEKSKQGLVGKYQSLSGTWSDTKYKDLGVIVDECSSAITSASGVLKDIVQKMEQLNIHIKEYEGVNFNAVGGNATNSSVDGLFGNRNSASASAEPSSGAVSQILNQPLSFRSISGDHSSAQDLSATNPNYIPRTNPNWTLREGERWGANCQRCVPTYEMRRRGYDVTARERPTGSDHLSAQPFDVWNNPNVIQCSGNGYYDIRNHMSSWGDGARAQVVVMWTRNRGHTFIAEQINGVTHFYEPQTGNTNVESYFSSVRSGQTRICRIDNAVPSERIYDCCEEVTNHD